MNLSLDLQKELNAIVFKTNNSKKASKYLDDALAFRDTCKNAGIMIHGCFMIGNLNETKESLKSTLKWAIKLNPDTAQFFPIMVYPGTLAYKQAEERGLIKSTDFRDWLTNNGLHNSVVDLPNITSKELVQFADYARKKFYTRPSYVLRKGLQSLKSPAELKRNIKGFKALSKFLLKGSDV